MKYVLLCVAAALMSFTSIAAENDTLFTLDGDPVYVSEFEYIYNKNNFNNKADYSEQSLRDYLELFINFRLKVKEAETLGLQYEPKLQSELKVYQEQLYNSFYDRQELGALVDEAFERYKSDVAISHIFVSAPEGYPEDKKSEALATIQKAWKALEDGQSFDEAAKTYSEDVTTKDNGGSLGYFTALQIAFYPLENAAWNTPVGSYSKPVKTQLGYHIVKVDDKRDARGKVKVAIIKLNLKEKDSAYNQGLHDEMNTLYDALQKGADFAQTAQQHTHDGNTRNKGGEMEWFGISKYDPTFEEKAFGLEKIGDITKPFEAAGALYIVKLLDRQQVDPATDRETVRQKVRQSDRYEMVRQQHIDGILNKYGLSKIEPALAQYRSKVVADLEAYQFNNDPNEAAFPLIVVAIDTFTNKDLNEYIASNNFKYRRLSSEGKFDRLLKDFINEKAIDFHVVAYGKENDEYGALLREYRDGILLFDLMETRVWSKAVQDTVGLRKYFEEHRSEFVWPERAVVRIFETEPGKKAAFLTKALKADPMLKNVTWLTKLRKKGIRTNYDEQIIYRDDEAAGDFRWEPGVQLKTNDGRTSVWQVVEIEKNSLKSFEDSKGFVIADYQEYLEDKWISQLRKQYKVVVNEDVLMSLVKE